MQLLQGLPFGVLASFDHEGFALKGTTVLLLHKAIPLSKPGNAAHLLNTETQTHGVTPNEGTDEYVLNTIKSKKMR